MSMHRPLIFDLNRSALLTMMVGRAFRKARERGVFVSSTRQEAEAILARRMIGAIEAGETQPEKLEALALQDDAPQAPVTKGDAFSTQYH